MLHFQSSEQMTSVHVPYSVNAVVTGVKKILFKNFLTPPQHSILPQTVADEGTEKNGLCSKKDFLK
jgi:hypothetical protein